MHSLLSVGDSGKKLLPLVEEEGLNITGAASKPILTECVFKVSQPLQPLRLGRDPINGGQPPPSDSTTELKRTPLAARRRGRHVTHD